MSAAYDVVVIGAGANGLVAAAALAKAGRRVLVLEREPLLGGQGRLIEFAPGFRAAPLSLDAGWVPPSVARGLRLDGLETMPDPGVSVVTQPGEMLTIPRDATAAAASIRRHSDRDAAKWPEFTGLLRRLAGFLETLYQAPAPDISASTPGELLPLLHVGRKFRALGRRDMVEFLRTLPLSVWELADDWFESAPLKAAIAAGGVQDHQQGPRSGGTGFVLLHHLVGAPGGSVRGRLPWRFGPEAFTLSAERAARRHGATIRTGASVARIDVADDRVTGVVLADGERIPARAVLSTANPARTLLEFCDPVWLDPEFMHQVTNIRHRGCTAIVMYAMDGLPPGASNGASGAFGGIVSLTNTIPALEKAADAAKYGTIADSPHVEITVPTIHWPEHAPAGKHVAAVRVQYAPYRLRDAAGWDGSRRDQLAERTTAALEAAIPGFGARVLHRAAYSPLDLEESFGLREGAPSQGELALDQILFMRPVAGWGGHDTPIGGLYLGGAGSHPGPGVLGGPGLLAASRMVSDLRRGGRRS